MLCDVLVTIRVITDHYSLNQPLIGGKHNTVLQALQSSSENKSHFNSSRFKDNLISTMNFSLFKGFSDDALAVVDTAQMKFWRLEELPHLLPCRNNAEHLCVE